MTGGPVDDFLAELARHVGRDDGTRRRIAAEVGDHLRDLVEEGRSRGLDEHAAEAEAVERFGSPRALARALRPAPRRSRRIAGAMAVAGVCAGLAFAGLRAADTGIGNPKASGATAVGCTAALSSGRPHGSGRAEMAIHLGVDPRYAAFTCLPQDAILFTDRIARPIERPPKGLVTMAEALHQ